MDYSEFDALPSKTDEISISEEPSHAGIRDMPSLEKAGEIISARITEIGRTPSEIADRSGVSESIVTRYGGMRDRTAGSGPARVRHTRRQTR